MSKARINKNIFERCLLTEVVPFETPLLFSNWGSFNYEYRLRGVNIKIIDKLFSSSKTTIPYSYRINKDLNDYRALQIPHPSVSKEVVDFYKRFDLMIPKVCLKSSFSIRAPHNIAKWFTFSKGEKDNNKYVEQIDENKAYASSYFAYKHFSHIYKFFESKQFSVLENRFSSMATFDISKFFPSIYTHSISWAIRGKNETKRLFFMHRKDRKSFSRSFDDLMQKINYNETNGIVVGPELSRIFSEIILQAVDIKIEVELRKNEYDYQYGKDYYCCRYIDDYFLFYNNDSICDDFEKCLKVELEKYKLYLNPNKRDIIKRPFITDASLLKIELSKYFNDLSSLCRQNKYIRSEKVIDRLRCLIGDYKDSLHKGSSFFFSALITSFRDISRFIDDNKHLSRVCILYFELALYFFKLDMRVSGSYKIIELTHYVENKLNKFTLDQVSMVNATMYYELTDALTIACQRKLVVESLNILICIKKLGSGYDIPAEMIDQLIEASQVDCPEDENLSCRNTYFDIATILHYVEDKTYYSNSKAKLLDQAKNIIKANNIEKYSETTMLFLDLLSCPHIDVSFKKDITEIVANNLGIASAKQDITCYINDISKYSWFFNWTYGNDLHQLLIKKKLMVSY